MSIMSAFCLKEIDNHFSTEFTDCFPNQKIRMNPACNSVSAVQGLSRDEAELDKVRIYST
jgi:hypothetical protein